MSKNSTPWVKPRHRIVRNLLFCALYPYVRWKYRIDITPFHEKEERPLLIVMNHQTGFDQFFVGLAFKHPIYYIASEDIFSLGWISRLICWLAAPIPIKKQTSDLRAVRTCMQVVKEGGTIALAPEGNRTFGGELCYIKPAILGLVRLLKLPLVTFRIEGGYGVHPRWSDVTRKGSMRAYASRVIEPEEYKAMSDEELMRLLQDELNVDETATDISYYSRKNAEYLERVFYVCPDCGLTEFESAGQLLTCRHCGMQVRYLPTREFELVRPGTIPSDRNVPTGSPFPFRFTSDWYRWQEDFVRKMDLTSYYETPISCDTGRLSEVILYDKKKVITKDARLSFYGNRLEIEIPEQRGSAGGMDFVKKQVWAFDDIDTITVLGKNKLNIYMGGKVYQVKSSKRFNALKYVHIFHHYKNILKGETSHGEFLGL